ncbi:hypothetical protein N0B44_06895 [Roseibacterium beibuensis]|uniref:hypothetical protein n=1 Tax=[Roseibacterium] beibuensis TaxID=1193142 RepID=UPI00217E4B6E|nr:hypothetical protein [Roseibacterium beibuensis]MCS6622630.1 hypothetical protein [Roseibacterium beibuensis]
MTAFEFFFSFYGLLLGLSLAVIATGAATAIQHRRKLRIGWLTPLLAVFVALDVASFWDFAWTMYHDVPFSYGLLVASLVVAVVYFIAASLVFPHQIEDGASLDDHFWANRKVVLLLTIAANVLALLVAVPVIAAKPAAAQIGAGYGFTIAIYIGLILPAALVRNRAAFATLVGLHIAIYLLSAIGSAVMPEVSDRLMEGPPPAADRP